MEFKFATAHRILFGPGRSDRLGGVAAGYGKRALVLTGSTPARVQTVLDNLARALDETAVFTVSEEPTTDTVKQALQRARQAKAELVVAIGGGSVIDTAKAVAAMLTNPGSLTDYLEVIGKGQPLTVRPAPCIAMPTTAGTGAEVTRNAVIAEPKQKVKVSLRHRWCLPRVALVDPLLTHSMPPAATAATGLDALTQLVEAYVCNKANPITDGICREGIRFAGRSLQAAYDDGADAAAREDMAVASLLSGLALANAGLGAVHGITGPLGGMFAAPHGALCGRLLPCVIKTNVAALRQRNPKNAALDRYDEIAQLLTGKASARVDDGLAWLDKLVENLHIPALADYGIDEEAIGPLVENALQASSMKSNPAALSGDELADLLRQAFRP